MIIITISFVTLLFCFTIEYIKQIKWLMLEEQATHITGAGQDQEQQHWVTFKMAK